MWKCRQGKKIKKYEFSKLSVGGGVESKRCRRGRDQNKLHEVWNFGCEGMYESILIGRRLFCFI